MNKDVHRLINKLHVPWITKEGYLDVTKYPLDDVLKQTLSPERDAFRSGCMMLQSMHLAGRQEAGIFLLGLLCWFRNDLEKLIVVVDALGGFKTKVCAEALFSELQRLPSSNTTRKYLAVVLKQLSRFPPEWIEDRFAALSKDKAFSSRMRNKFKAIAQQGHPSGMDYDCDDDS